jgi:hypothetical protein
MAEDGAMSATSVPFLPLAPPHRTTPAEAAARLGETKLGHMGAEPGWCGSAECDGNCAPLPYTRSLPRASGRAAILAGYLAQHRDRPAAGNRCPQCGHMGQPGLHCLECGAHLPAAR